MQRWFLLGAFGLAACGSVSPGQSDSGAAGGGAGTTGVGGSRAGSAGSAAGTSVDAASGGSSGGAAPSGVGGTGGGGAAGAGVDAAGGASATTDASTDLPANPDVRPETSSCKARPFGTPEFVMGAVNSVSDELGPRLSADELTIYFARRAVSVPAGVTDLYVATRPNLTAPFDTPVPLSINTTTASESEAMVTADGLTLFFSSDRPQGAGEFDLYFATRAIATVGFLTASAVPGVNTPGTETQPFLASGGDLWFAYRGPGADTTPHLRRAPKTTVGFGTPIPIPELDSPVDDAWPVLSADELTIYFSSSRVDPAAQGKPDVWVAHRATQTSHFEALAAVVELNTPAGDNVGWLSPDGCRIYLSSNRRTTGGYDVYVASR